MNQRESTYAVVLLSGGMDSSVCLALAISEGYTPACLHLNYGQRTEQRELRAFHDMCSHYNVEHRLCVDVSYLKDIGGSSLTDERIEVERAKLKRNEIPSSYVPFRNANILAIATSWAEVIRAKAIFIGAVEEDSSGYPDCRREFFDAFEGAIRSGTKPETNIRIITPLINLHKADIVRRGAHLSVPYELTWSCYQSSDKACGVCDSCALRLRGFQSAGIEDPLEYVERPFYS